MKTKILFVAFSLIFVSLLVIGCGEKKIEPKQVGEFTQYKDPLYSFEVSFPKEWSKSVEIGTAKFFPTKDDEERFTSPFDGAGKGGAQVKVTVRKNGDVLDDYVKNIIDTIRKENRMVEDQQKITVDGIPAVKLLVSSYYGKANKEKAFRVYSIKDSLLTVVELAGFNTDWEAYQKIFDAVLQKVKLPVKPAAGASANITEKPSDKFDNYSTPFFSVGYPDNFNFSSPPKGNNELSVELKGYRSDCTVRFDVFPAKGLTVEKVVNQNKDKYKGGSPSPTNIDGTGAQFINYSIAKGVNSRVYFVVKNDKVIRITLNWFTAEKDTYLPVFEKVVSSLKLK